MLKDKTSIAMTVVFLGLFGCGIATGARPLANSENRFTPDTIHLEGGSKDPAAKGTGKLLLSKLEPRDGAAFLLAKPPECKRPPWCTDELLKIYRALSIKEMSQFAACVTPVKGDIELRKLSLIVYSKGKQVFTIECGECPQTLKLLNASKGARPGYVFVLDEATVKAARPYFVPGNTIGISADISGDVEFSFVNIQDTRPREQS